MLHEERVKYETLKAWALESYFVASRDYGVMRRWPHEQIVGFVSGMFEDGLERPIEDIMWRVLLLVLSGGLHPDLEEKQRQFIVNEIAKYGLENLLVDVPKDEVNLFRHDLEILKVI